MLLPRPQGTFREKTPPYKAKGELLGRAYPALGRAYPIRGTLRLRFFRFGLSSGLGCSDCFHTQNKSVYTTRCATETRDERTFYGVQKHDQRVDPRTPETSPWTYPALVRLPVRLQLGIVPLP